MSTMQNQKELYKIENDFNDRQVETAVQSHLGRTEITLIERYKGKLLVVAVIPDNDKWMVYNYYPLRTMLGCTCSFDKSRNPREVAQESMNSLKSFYDL